jgi:hypothetical protein
MALYAMKRLPLLIALSAPTFGIAADTDCQVGGQCSLTGVLRIYRTPPVVTSSLDLGGKCVPLALPKSAYDNYKKWNDRPVVVTGIAHSHGVADDALYYVLDGRNVTGAACRGSAVALFVTKLKLSK